MNNSAIKNQNKIRLRRKKRVRSRIKGTEDRPRISVFRSAKYIYAQLIDDKSGKTLVHANDKEIDYKNISKSDMKGDAQTMNLLRAYKTGEMLAERAKDKKVTVVVFDKSQYKYHGRVKALAEGARAGGLKF